MGGAFAYAGAVGAVAAFLTWGQDPLRAPTVRGCAVALPVVIALAFGAASGVASTRDYATDPRTLAADVTVCVLVFLAGAALTRALVLLRAGASQRPSASPTNAW
jgi:hypothetical protein